MRGNLRNLVLVLIFLTSTLSVLSTNVAADPMLITINADGSIDPALSPLDKNGNVYTLTQNISARIVVERSDIVLEGNGHLLYGENQTTSYGIYIENSDLITIQNFTIRYFHQAIHFKHTKHSIVRGNIVEHNVADGIYAGDTGIGYAGENVTIIDNIARHNGESGIYLDDFQGCHISTNLIENNTLYGIRIHGPVDGHFIYNNTIRYNGDDGIFHHYDGDLNHIRCNRIHDNLGTGVVFNSGWNNEILENIFINNVGAFYFGEYGGMISHDNLVWRNTFIDNPNGLGNQGGATASAYDLNFSKDNDGNFWSDYTGVDGNGDGKGDTPYDIDGTNSDPSPLMEQPKCTYVDYDEPPPYIVSIHPLDGSVDVPISTVVMVNFSKEMNQTATNGSFVLKKDADAVTGSIQWGQDGKGMTFTASNALEHDTTYIIEVTTEAKDTAGQHLQDTSITDFKTEGPPPDTTPPFIISIIPSDGSMDVDINTTVIVTFSEPMDRTTTQGAFSLERSASPVVGTIAWSNDDAVLTFTPGSPLAYGTIHNIWVETTATDIAGNPLVAIGSSNFTTEDGPIPPPPVDTTPPELVMIDPPHMATDVSIAKSITVQFSEPMDRTTTESAFRLYNAASDVVGIIQWQGLDEMFVFRPYAPLEQFTIYRIQVTTIARDKNGNNLLVGNETIFTTEKGTGVDGPPRILGIEPVDKAVDVPLDTKVVVTFSEAMTRSAAEGSFNLLMMEGTQGLKLSGSFNWSLDSKVMYFTPKGVLDEGRTYKIKVTNGGTDVTGNHIENPTETTFKTKDKKLVPPTPPSHPPGQDWGKSEVEEGCWPLLLVLLIIVLVFSLWRFWDLRRRQGMDEGEMTDAHTHSRNGPHLGDEERTEPGPIYDRHVGQGHSPQDDHEEAYDDRYGEQREDGYAGHVEGYDDNGYPDEYDEGYDDGYY